jgi:hypothetical protein
MQKDINPELTSYEDVARDYLVKYAPQEAWEERLVSQSPTLSQAIELACARLPHVRLYQTPKKAADLLRPLADQIANSCKNFHDLHQFILKSRKSVPGMGPLTCYDIAQRIGVWLKLEPTEVYLHAGTREGAKAVQGTLANQDRMPMNDFPEGLRRSLTAAQLEDVLCIYRGTLARIAGNGQIETTSHGITRCPAQPRTPRPGGCRKT